MNKRIILLHLALFAGLVCCSQSLEEFNRDRLDLNKKGMWVLGTWAVANLLSSPVLASRTEGSTRYFHQMNGYWNTVNLVLAGVGYYSAATTDAALLTFSETVKAQHTLEKILLFNAGLDLAYIAGGFFLQERAKTTSKHQDRLKGFGRSLILQGAFLFVFDLGFYWAQTHHGRELVKWMNTLSVGSVGPEGAMGIQFSLFL